VLVDRRLAPLRVLFVASHFSSVYLYRKLRAGTELRCAHSHTVVP
jgi:hypothetical protein